MKATRFDRGVSSISIETHKAVVRDFYAAINRGDFNALSQYCHPGFVFYNQVDTPHPGVEGLVLSKKRKLNAFSG